ncbi:MAG: hypothetical protein E6J34_15020 [Chloroflexi bacterium]|nr:MAG: hypothetical protein E6J34_15020 [Chloroflexota bacterium]
MEEICAMLKRSFLIPHQLRAYRKLFIPFTFIVVATVALAGCAGTTTTSQNASTQASTSCTRSVPVSGDAALAAATSAAQAGDCLLLSNGTYKASSFTISGPVQISAQNPLKAVISAGTMTLTGSHKVIQGLTFTGTANVALNDCVNCRVTRSFFKNTKGDAIHLSGNNDDANRIDHNEFGPMPQKAHYIDVGGGTVLAKNTQIDHNYFHDHARYVNGADTITLGGVGGVSGDIQNAHSIIEFNLFVRCNGENEMIENKSSGNIIRYNTVLETNGAISLRAGNNVSVYGNFVFGKGVAGSGGIRMWGDNHLIYDNYIDVQSFSIFVGAGDAAAPGAHFALHNPHIFNNTFISEGESAVNLGVGGHKIGPDNMIFANNIAQSSHGPVIRLGPAAPTNPTYANNIVNPLPGATAGITATAGQWQVVDPKLTHDAVGVSEPASGSPAIQAGSNAYASVVTEDIFGRTRTSPPDIGAVQSGSGGARHPLALAEVGPTAP